MIVFAIRMLAQLVLMAMLSNKVYGLSLSSNNHGQSEAHLTNAMELADEWVPLGLVAPDFDSFWKHVLNISEKRHLISDQELNRIPATPVPPFYRLLGYTLFHHPPKEGMYLEFGVATGASINLTGKIVRALHNDEHINSVVDGFDTFWGLPEAWPGYGPQGAFSRNGVPPPVVANVKLHKGLFNETLPGYLADHQSEPLAFANIDCDLYAGAMQVLNLLQEHLREGSLLHFHELVQGMHPSQPQQELKALHDFLLKPQNKGLQLEVLNWMNPMFPQPPSSPPVVLRVASMPHVGGGAL